MRALLCLVALFLSATGWSAMDDPALTHTEVRRLDRKAATLDPTWPSVGRYGVGHELVVTWDYHRATLVWISSPALPQAAENRLRQSIAKSFRVPNRWQSDPRADYTYRELDLTSRVRGDWLNKEIRFDLSPKNLTWMADPAFSSPVKLLLSHADVDSLQLERPTRSDQLTTSAVISPADLQPGLAAVMRSEISDLQLAFLGFYGFFGALVLLLPFSFAWLPKSALATDAEPIDLHEPIITPPKDEKDVRRRLLILLAVFVPLFAGLYVSLKVVGVAIDRLPDLSRLWLEVQAVMVLWVVAYLGGAVYAIRKHPDKVRYQFSFLGIGPCVMALVGAAIAYVVNPNTIALGLPLGFAVGWLLSWKELATKTEPIEPSIHQDAMGLAAQLGVSLRDVRMTSAKEVSARRTRTKLLLVSAQAVQELTRPELRILICSALASHRLRRTARSTAVAGGQVLGLFAVLTLVMVVSALWLDPTLVLMPEAILLVIFGVLFQRTRQRAKESDDLRLDQLVAETIGSREAVAQAMERIYALQKLPLEGRASFELYEDPVTALEVRTAALRNPDPIEVRR